MKKLISILCCIIAISSHIKAASVEKQKTFHQLIDNYFRAVIEINPSTASHLGMNPDGYYHYDKSKLTDNSEAAYQHELKLVNEYIELSREFSDLPPEDELEHAVFQNYLQDVSDTDRYRYNYYVLNHIFGFHYQLINLFTENHSINTRQDAEDYLARMEQLTAYFDNLFLELQERERRGIIPPLRIMEHLQNILDDLIGQNAEEIIYYTHFIDRIDQMEELDGTTINIYKDRALKAVRDHVLPNYKKVSEHIEQLKNKAGIAPGVWKLPEGDKFYQFCLQKHTTTNLTPKEIHQIGLQEVARIQTEMLQRFEELGFTDGENFGDIESQYWHSLQGSEFNYVQNEFGRKQALDDYLQIIEETEKRLPDIFEKIPSIPVTVRAVPPHKEQYSGQYYDDAPLDGSRPAIFYTNLSWLPKKPGMQALLYHETIPGHHLQIAYAQELANIPMYRNFTFFTAFIEGWALYAEKLALELGWYKDIYSELGYLNSELFRAVRLVVDTGIHYKRWSREQAAEYMEENLGWASYGEIDRYTVWPGQACAYKIGELKLLELREKAKLELGDTFDLKEFHDVILRNGTIPLDLLENVVDEWLERKS